MSLTDARRLKRDDMPLDEVRSLVESAHQTSKANHLLECLSEIEDYDGDIAVVEGDLTIDGDLDMIAEGLVLLVVKGNLVVTGCLRDYDDPESFVIVHGDVRAGSVITAGWLEVHGDLIVERVLLGDYNDCAAWIDGNVRAPLFFGEEHHFTINGALEANVVLGRPRLAIATEPTAIPLTDARVLEYIDRDLLRTLDDEDDDGNPIVEVDGFINFNDVKKRVATRAPLLTRTGS